MPERPTEEGVGEQVKTIEYRFYEAINENKEHAEPSVSVASRRRQATIFSEGQEIPPPQPDQKHPIGCFFRATISLPSPKKPVKQGLPALFQ